MSKLSDVVKNEFVKNTVYDNSAVKVNNIDTSDFALTTKYQTDKAELFTCWKRIEKAANFWFSLFYWQKSFWRGWYTTLFTISANNRYFKVIANTDFVSSWKSKGLSAESIKTLATSDNSLTPALSYYGTKTRVKFHGSCLKQPKGSFDHKTIVNIYIVYELGAFTSNSDDPTLRNCLFDTATLTKNADIDKYGYSGYGIGFDRKSSFSFPGGGFGQNVIIFGADMSYSAHVDNKKKYILIFGKGPTEGLEHTLAAEKMCSINFTVTRK